MIKVNGISKSFESIPLLNQASFELAEGEKACLVGPGGCGKSTLLKIILGLLAPDSGTVHLGGQDLNDISNEDRQSLMKKVGMAFQQGGLFDHMTVRENLDFALTYMKQSSPEEKSETINRLLEGVRLAKTGDMFPHELSGGMKRRVGIARALCTDPKIAIFDEPTSGLDPVTSTIILNMIKGLAGNLEDRTMLVATSNVEIAVRFAARIILLKDGKIVADGAWKDLLIHGDDWVRHFLGVRFIGLDASYAKELDLPDEFIESSRQLPYG